MKPRFLSSFAIRSLLFLVTIAAIIVTAVVLGRGKPSSVVANQSTLRIVSLSPAITVTLRDLGLQDLIVGRDGFDLVLPKSIHVCGDLQGIDYERLLQVHPTHILLQLGAKSVPDRLRDLAATQSWKVANLSLVTLDDIKRTTQDLALTFGASAGPLTAAMDRACTPRAEFKDAGRVLLLAATDPPAALGPGSFHQQILERIGGTPAITSGSMFITLDAEDVLKLKPDAIILILPRDAGAPPSGPRTPEQLRAALGRLAQLDIPAFKNDRVALIDDPLAHTPSTAMIHLADEMAEILAGWTGPH